MVRGSLGATDVAASTTARYPFFAIKITDLLALDKWRPHQDLLAEGKMVEMTVEMLKEIDVIKATRPSKGAGQVSDAYGEAVERDGNRT